MEQKVVKFEIGKLLAVVITVVVVALVASIFLRSSFFRGGPAYITTDRFSEGATAPLTKEVYDAATPLTKEAF